MITKLLSATSGPRSRWVTLIVWLATAIILTVTLPGVKEMEQNNSPNLTDNSASVIADELIQTYFPNAAGIPALLVWQNNAKLSSEDFDLISNLSTTLQQNPIEGLTEAAPFNRLPLAQMASEDGRALVYPLFLSEGMETSQVKEKLQELQARTTDLAGTDPFALKLGNEEGLTARITGPAGILVDATGLFQGADFVLLIATVLLVLVLLLLIYRSPILAIIPLIGVMFAYAVTSPILGWMASEGWIVIDGQSIAIMTVLLFGAGTDYCLFFITRFRQELTQTEDRWLALKQSFQGASGAIAMSGMTVMLALLCLLTAQYGSYQRFAVPFGLSIFIMVIASLTLVPALLAIMGRTSFFPFIPRTEQAARAFAEKRGKVYHKPNPDKKWGNRIGKLVVTKPWTVAISATAALAVLAVFAFQIQYKYDLLSTFPEDMPSREGFAVIAESFEPGQLAPLTVVVKPAGDSQGKQEQQAALLENLRSNLLDHPHVSEVSQARQSAEDEGYYAYTVTFGVSPYAEEAMQAIPELRLIAENTLAADGQKTATEDHVWLGGQTAQQFDTQALNMHDMKLIFPLIIGLIALLLLAYLRSIIATIYLVATVLLSYVAALGLGWLILHYGLGVDAIQGAIPIYAFVFLIALGEDYNIFMVSSIWKKIKVMPLRQAIKEGVGQTGGVITSAGIILAATFAVLASLPLQVLVQFGLITAIGVLLDTFVVRPFLVPAITALLGKYAFWPSRKAMQAVTASEGQKDLG